MLEASEAKKIGIRACIEKIGWEFCRKYEQNACTTCGEHDKKMFCSVGIDDQEFIPDPHPTKLILSENGFQYYASCDVDMTNGMIEFLECRVPETITV